MRTHGTGGPFLRIALAVSAVAAGLVVVSATFGLGRAHWAAALVALPMLVAGLVAAVVAYRRLVVPAATKNVAHRCTRSLTLPWPNNITPRKPASRKNAVRTS